MSYAKYNQQIYVCKDKKLTKKMAVQTKRIVFLFFFVHVCQFKIHSERWREH